MPFTDAGGAKCPSSSDRVRALLVLRRGLAFEAVSAFFFRASRLALCWSRWRLGFATGPGLRMLLVCAGFLEAAVIGTCRASAKWTDLVVVLANLTLEGASRVMTDLLWAPAIRLRLAGCLRLEVLALERC